MPRRYEDEDLISDANRLSTQVARAATKVQGKLIADMTPDQVQSWQDLMTKIAELNSVIPELCMEINEKQRYIDRLKCRHDDLQRRNTQLHNDIHRLQVRVAQAAQHGRFRQPGNNNNQGNDQRPEEVVGPWVYMTEGRDHGSEGDVRSSVGGTGGTRGDQ